MTSKTFVDRRTVIDAAWLNSADDFIYRGTTATGTSTKRSFETRFADEINVKDFGAVGNGTTDDTAAIQAAITAAGTIKSPKVVIPSGEYLVSDTITFNLPDGSTLECVGTFKSSVSNKAAIIVGRAGENGAFYTVNGLKVFRSVGSDTTGTSIGIVLLNLIASKVEIQECYFFRYGVKAFGDGLGFSYNNIYLGAIRDNRDNLTLTSSAGGYCNECNWFGGTFNHSSSYSTVVTTTHINIEDRAPELGNHRFYGPSFEDSTNSTLNTAMIINGDQNVVFWPRLEHDYYQSTYLIKITAAATGCGIIGGGFGVNSENIQDLGAVSSWDAYDQTSVKCSTPDTAGKGVLRLRGTSTSTARALLIEDATGTETTSIRGDGRVIVPTIQSIQTTAVPTSYANDVLAKAAGVPVGGLYRNGNVIQIVVS